MLKKSLSTGQLNLVRVSFPRNHEIQFCFDNNNNNNNNLHFNALNSLALFKPTK